MKKRILSALLLIAMVVTMVPVMAASASAEATSSTETDYDYTDLYVKDGLVNLYTAFIGDTSSVSIVTSDNGSKWASRVEGGSSAWLKDDGHLWHVGERGGVGFDYLYGYLDNGTFTAQSFSCMGIGNQALIFGGIGSSGIAGLPTEDATIEYVAEYKPVYVATDATGATIATDANGKKLETYSYQNYGIGGYASWPIDSIGWFQSYTNKLDGAEWGGGRGAMHFVMNSTYWSSGGNGRWIGSGSSWGGAGGLNKAGDPFHKLGGIYSYAYVLDETVTTVTDEEAGTTTTTTTALFEMYRGGTLYNSNADALNTSANGTHRYGYYNLDESGNGNSFHLSAGRPTDFYAVRIYDRLLTSAEKAQNHMADILGFYDIKIPNLTKVVEGLKASTTSFASFTFANDATTYAANKIAVQEFVDTIVEDGANYADSLYVRDGLTGLFTAFGTASNASLTPAEGSTSGVWTNLIYGGFNATLGNASRWYKGTSLGGGLGFNVFSGEIAADGTFNATSTYDTWKDSYTFLNFGGENLPDEDYTVEYLAMQKPVYVANAADGSIAKDATTGLPIQSHDMNPGFSGGAQDYRTDKAPVFALGYFSAYGVAIDTDTSTWGMKRGCLIWVGNQINWSAANKSWWIGTGSCSWNRNSGMSWNWTTGDGFIVNDKIITYMITLDETTTTTDAVVDEETGEETTPATTTTTALFSLYRDGSVWQSNASAINSTANAEGAKYYIDNWGGNFYLSAGYPIEYYAVRIYDRLLTADEQAQNRFVDMVQYYGLTISPEFAEDSALLADAITEFAAVDFTTDATEYAANKVALQAVLDAGAPEFGGYEDLYIKNGLTALFTAYDDSYVDLTTGTWTNRVNNEKNATLGNKAYWTVGANGGVSSTMLWGSYIDGVFSATADTNNFDVLGTRLEFGIDLLPSVDYTVEYVAQYNNVMAVDANGKPAVAINTIADATWPSNAALGGNQTVANTAVDQLGNLMSFSNSGRDKAFATGAEGYYGGLGSLAWRHNANRPANGWNSGSGAAGLFKASDIWQTRGSINTFEISRDATGYTNSVITLTRNGNVYSSQTFTESIADEHNGTDDYFYLGERLSVDYYAVRIYNRILTAEEKTQNHFVDLVLFYDLTVPEEMLADADVMAQLYTAFSAETMVADATARAAKKAELQNVITPTLELGGAADIYVKSGLKALYTAFSGETYVNLEAGTWTDRVSGKTATLGNKSLWTLDAAGGVGVQMLWGSYIDGVFSADSTYNNAETTGTRLEFGIEQLPTGDYTVEYVALYGNYMAVDANGKPVVAINTLADATWPSNTASITGSGSVSYNPVDQLGHLSSLTYQRNGHFAGAANQGYYGGLGALAWQYNSNRPANLWNSGNGQYYGGRGLYVGGAANAFHQRDAIHTYEISRALSSGTETINDVETPVTYSQITLARDLVDYKSMKAYTDISNEQNAEGGSYFYLAERMTVDFYAVRIYNRTLTTAEKNQNKLADLLQYYNIEVPESMMPGGANFDALVSALSGVSFVTDEIERAGVALTIQATINDIEKSSAVLGLYVQDNLVALYTALSPDDGSAATDSGVWANRVSGGAPATLVGSDRWVRNADGSVGTTQIYGSYVDGKWNAESEYNTYLTDGTGVHTQLKFDSALLSNEDHTVEFVAQFRPIMAVDLDGNPVAETYNVGTLLGGGGGSAYHIGSAAVNQIGFLRSWTTHRDGTFNNGSYARGYQAWTMGHSYWGGTSGWAGCTDNTNLPTTRIVYDMEASGNPYYANNQIFSYAIVKDEVTADDVTTGTWTLYRDGAVYNSATPDWAIDYTKDDAATGNFYLADYLSVDFFAVRVYSDVLTPAELAQNNAIDIAYYYGLTLPEEAYTDDAVLAAVVDALRSAEIVTDATEKAANKVAYQKLIDDIDLDAEAATGYDYDSLYVQSGLRGLYTTFAGDTSVDIYAGTWQNKIDNEYGAATIRGASLWDKYEVGIGYTMDLATWKLSGKSAGINLPAEFEDLDNFTVESFVKAKGILKEDGTRYEHTREEAQYGYWTNNASAFRFGMLNAIFFVTMNGGYDDNGRFAARWFVSNWTYAGGDELAVDPSKGVKVYTDAESDDYSDQGFRNMGPMYVPTAGVMQVSKATDASGNVTYAIAYDNNETPEKTVTISAADYAGYLAKTPNTDAAGRFSLFTSLPSDVYAIRVYNRELTTAEKLQNNFVDKAGFYQIDITGFADFTDDKKLAVYNLFAGIGTDLDPLAAQAIYDLQVNGGTDKAGDSVISFNQYQPILNGAYGYRALFAVSEDAVAMLEANGYTVSYGAIVAPAASNAMSDLVISSASASAITTSAANGQLVIVGGPLGSEIFYNFTDTGAGKLSFSAAVTSSDAAYYGSDVLVRGFVVVTDANGNNKYYYDDAYENEVLDGSVSILNAADYFVNEYEGNVATAYSYMNSAVLREILQTSGRDCRRALMDDLVLYVDVDGSDENSGLTENAPLATLDAAHAATVAHLAKTGMKSVTIYLSAGTHFIENSFTLDGDAILADEYFVKVIGAGEETVISSAKPIDLGGYTEYSDGIYYVELPRVNGEYPNFRDLVGYAEGERYPITMAQNGDAESNFTISDIQFTNGTSVYDADGAYDWELSDELAATTTSAILTLPASAFVSGANYTGTELHFTVQWSFNIMHIEKVEISGSTAKVYIDYDEFKNIAASGNHSVTGDVVWMKNSLGLLADGNADSFAYDQTSGRLYYKVGDINLTDYEEVRYASLENLFVLNNAKNVTISDVSMTGYNTQMIAPGLGYGFGQSASNNMGNFFTAAGIYANAIDGLTVRNVKFFDADATGVSVKGVSKNIIVDSSRFENLGDAAIRIGESGWGESLPTNYLKNITITNNYINEIGNTFNSASGITITTAANLLIAHNTITNVPYSGMSVGWKWVPNGPTIDNVRAGIYRLYNVEIAYNYIADFMLSSMDGGAIYTLGGALPKTDDTMPNYVHHNYVNVTAGTGNHRGETGFFAPYYHDGGSSNWYTYSNVLMNSKSAAQGLVTGTFSLFFTQYNDGNDANNINLEGNYTIGVSSAAAFDRDEHEFDRPGHNVQTSHYAFASVSALNSNTCVTGTYEGINLVSAPAGSAATVYSIYAAAGSSYGAGTKASGGLTTTAAAIQDEIRLTEEFVDASVGNTLPYTATFVLDGETVTTKVTAGAIIGVPGEFDAVGTTYEFSIDGETIDPTTYVMPSKDITIDVTATVADYKVTITDGIVKVTHTLKAGEAVPTPDAFTKDGYDTNYTYDGMAIDFATFTMPADDITIYARYTVKSYNVTFSDGTTTIVKKMAYGDTLTIPAYYAKTGHTVAAYIGDVDVTLNYAVPAEDISVEVRYLPKTYDVIFYNADGSKYTTVPVVYGTVITLPENPAGTEDDDYVYEFAGWDGYTEGMILETEGASFTAIENAVEKTIVITFMDGETVISTKKYVAGATIVAPADPERADYTFTGWDGYTEGMVASSDMTFTATYEANAPAYALGDLDGDGSVNAFDITMMIAVIGAAEGETVDGLLGETDLDGDGSVNAFDLTTLIELAGSAS